MEDDLLGTQKELCRFFMTDSPLRTKSNRPWEQNYKLAIIQLTYLNHYLLSTYVLVAKLNPKDTEMNQVYPCPQKKKKCVAV